MWIKNCCRISVEDWLPMNLRVHIEEVKCEPEGIVAGQVQIDAEVMEHEVEMAETKIGEAYKPSPE